MGFSRQKRIYINDVEEFNKLLAIARDDRVPVMHAPEPGQIISCMAFIDDKLTKTELTLKSGSVATYVFNKDCRKDEQEISGLDAYNQIAKAFSTATGYKIPLYDQDIGSAVAILAYRPEFEENRIQAYSYDQNSSYGWALTQPMPDTREIVGYCDTVKPGQIGFIMDDEPPIPNFISAGGAGLRMVREGGGAEYIFNAMESPFKKFAELWYSRKLKPETKSKAKQMLCYSVGYLQRKNPFLRAAVVEYANQYIRSLIDENTIYVNTDCIISTQPRDDLPIGQGLGEFKEDHKGLFANVGFNYQWNDNIPIYRGIPKTWFKEGWDILKDPIPDNQNIYELNAITLQMEARKYENPVR